jgi:hypothetical protein
MRLFEIIIESKQIALAKKAYALLSLDAKHAIDSWETSNWIGGPLEKHVKANDEIAQEIERAFKPVRDSIPGNTVKLYRGVQNQDEEHNQHLKNRILESWSSERSVAEYFAGLRTQQTKNGRSLMKQIPTAQEIDQAVAQYNAKGYLNFRGKYYLRNKDNPGLYNIYDRNKQYVTDGDDIRNDLTYWLKDDEKWNEKKKKKSTVIEKDINKNQIIWITNNLNSKEYIVRVR